MTTWPAEPGEVRQARTIELEEWRDSAPLRLDAADLAALQSLPRGRLGVVPAGAPDAYVLRATSWVGSVRLPRLEVRIRPKVDDLTNVLMMFGAVAGAVEWQPEHTDFARADLVEGIAELVLREIDTATRRGLLHGYESREERVPVLRGRVLVEEVAARPWEAWPVPCRYDDFTPDVAENRVLLATVLEVDRWSTAPTVRRLAASLLGRLGGVSRSQAPLSEADLIRSSVVNEHYQPSLALCRLVLEGYGVEHTAGGTSAQAFLLDMNDLYERWIGAELTWRIWPHLVLEEQAAVALSRRPQVMMAPDLVFRSGDQPVLVGDVKYKLTGTGLARTPDYYQLLAYCTAMELRRGILIYCQADVAPEREITIEGGGQQVICHPLSLAGTWDEVSSSLDALARRVRALSRG